MSNTVTITLQSPKGAQWQMQAVETKLATIKLNAKRMGYKIVKITK